MEARAAKLGRSVRGLLTAAAETWPRRIFTGVGLLALLGQLFCLLTVLGQGATATALAGMAASIVA